MRTVANSLRPLAGRTLQCLLDPLAVFVPGWSWLVQACGLCRNSGRYVSPDRLAGGLVVVLPGIEGPSLYTAGLRAGLGDLPAAVMVHHWAGFWPGLVCALSVQAARRRAGRMVAMIGDYRRAYPGRAVVLVGHSGGAAIAILAAQALGPGDPLDGLIALATPLSPDYDLTGALAGLRRPMVACHSRLDLQLRMLTGIGGNFDRRFGRTAGQQGFEPPGQAGPDGRLVQIAWDRSMIADGHWGGHVGWTSPPWVRRHLAPLVARWLEPSAPPQK